MLIFTDENGAPTDTCAQIGGNNMPHRKPAPRHTPIVSFCVSICVCLSVCASLCGCDIWTSTCGSALVLLCYLFEACSCELLLAGGGKCSIWEGGTRGISIITSPLLKKVGFTYHGLAHAVGKSTRNRLLVLSALFLLVLIYELF